ncbi:hypothetical protein HPB49_006905 [Dermacentor silvarum]|uniref:Uncharacterized protein n=1 Tax=Dermacentor silvarum TaxID=543639 RepID=A0ACB8D352_DERSI|nr:hypothetical protein HPB49_006905 [Dermacentor silvarum]
MTGKDEESAPVPKIDEPKDSTRPHQDKSGAHTPTSLPAAAKRPHAQTSTDGVQTMTSGVEEPPAKTVQVRRSSLRSCLNVSVDKRSGADDTEVSLPDNVWLYSDQLRFLKDTVEGRATSGNLDDGKSAEELFHTMTRPRSITLPGSPVQENADIEDLFALEDDVDVSQPSTSSRQSTTLETAGQDPLSRKPQVQSQTNGQRSRKRKGDPLQQEIDEVSQRLAKHKPLDEDEYFALSLVPTMREFPKHKRLRMRIEVLELLESLKQAC